MQYLSRRIAGTTRETSQNACDYEELVLTRAQNGELSTLLVAVDDPNRAVAPRGQGIKFESEIPSMALVR